MLNRNFNILDTLIVIGLTLNQNLRQYNDIKWKLSTTSQKKVVKCKKPLYFMTTTTTKEKKTMKTRNIVDEKMKNKSSIIDKKFSQTYLKL